MHQVSDWFTASSALCPRAVRSNQPLRSMLLRNPSLDRAWTARHATDRGGATRLAAHPGHQGASGAAGRRRAAAVRALALRLECSRGFRLARRSRHLPSAHRRRDHGCPHGPDRHPRHLRSVLCPVGSILWRADGRAADESGLGRRIDRTHESRRDRWGRAGYRSLFSFSSA